jgi:hypothetical protein
VHKYPSSYSLSADTSTANSEHFENIESSYPDSLSKYLKWVLVVGLRTAAACIWGLFKFVVIFLTA